MKRLSLRNSLFFSLLGIALPLASSAGARQKAEGKPIVFARGATSATYSERIQNDHQHDFEFSGQAGQTLVLRLVSKPARSVVPILRLHAQKQPLRYDNKETWRIVLPETGGYFLSLLRPGGKPGVSTCALTVSLPPRKTTVDSATPDAAMRSLIAALQANDRTAFLALFSRAKPFYALNPMMKGDAKHYRVAISYAQLAQDMQRKTGLYGVYMARMEDMDAFVDNITTTQGRRWRRVGAAKFVPTDHPDDFSTYVRWRKEGARWVVDEISYPQA